MLYLWLITDNKYAIFIFIVFYIQGDKMSDRKWTDDENEADNKFFDEFDAPRSKNKQWYLDKINSYFNVRKKSNNYLKKHTESELLKKSHFILQNNPKIEISITKQSEDENVYAIKINNLLVGLVTESFIGKGYEKEYENDNETLYTMTDLGLIRTDFSMTFKHNKGVIELENMDEAEPMLKVFIEHTRGGEMISKILARQMESSRGGMSV